MRRARYVRLIHPTIAEQPTRDQVDYFRERRAFLLDGNGVVHVLVAQILDSRCQVSEEDCTLSRQLYSTQREV